MLAYCHFSEQHCKRFIVTWVSHWESDFFSPSILLGTPLPEMRCSESSNFTTESLVWAQACRRRSTPPNPDYFSDIQSGASSSPFICLLLQSPPNLSPHDPGSISGSTVLKFREREREKLKILYKFIQKMKRNHPPPTYCSAKKVSLSIKDLLHPISMCGYLHCQVSTF